ncbi:hypothetical protein [Ruminococcus sp.]|mgnify:CR=1 FL=1|uniref:hypothetical protein n=1 Tax=Ruminococcus sp. TaxID=41978 RepID=UPI002BC7DE0E|nr:hypothetical protein [Ruminococcus sp.]HNZ98825.1 hypothetical protein [Ruminococcus sp.]HOH86791.1 hypothetical protein [Ruminococcus sp.]
MRVDYYGMDNCTYDMYCGRPALFAPEGADEAMLAGYGFARLPDGRYIHFLDQQEYFHIINNEVNGRVVFDQATHYMITQYYRSQYAPPPPVNRSEGGTVMCIISLALFLISPLLILVNPGISMLGWIASLVLMIIVKATYPKNVFGTVLLILHIVAFVVGFIALLLLMAACYDILNQCSHIA